MRENEMAESRLVERLRHQGIRLTPQRLAVYRALVNTDQHPTAAMLYDELQGQIPSLSPATVYNTLQVLVDNGLVHEIGDAGDGSTHYDADLTPHVNLICRQCQRIIDYHDPRLAGLETMVGEGSGFTIQGARLVYYGLCPECARVEQGNS